MKKLKVSVAGCSLADFLYADIDFNSPAFKACASVKDGDGGLMIGKLIFADALEKFKGIPYAAPPVGDLRWRAPQPAQDWEGVRDCARFGPIAMQETPGLESSAFYSREWHVDPEIPMSEDCLQFLICALCGSPDVQVEAVFAATLTVALHGVGAEFLALQHAVPGHYGLRGFPAELANRRSGERNAFIYSYIVQDDTLDGTSGHLHLTGNLAGACAQSKRSCQNDQYPFHSFVYDVFAQK